MERGDGESRDPGPRGHLTLRAGDRKIELAVWHGRLEGGLGLRDPWPAPGVEWERQGERIYYTIPVTHSPVISKAWAGYGTMVVYSTNSIVLQIMTRVWVPLALVAPPVGVGWFLTRRRRGGGPFPVDEAEKGGAGEGPAPEISRNESSSA